MAPFRRGRSSDVGPGTRAASADNRESAWEARRRRKQQQAQQQQTTSSSSTHRRKQDLPAEDYDPYDSDPGESYRDHCERIKGERMRSCLTIPRFLQNNKVGDVTEATTPASPLEEEEEVVAQGPRSLPKDLARVRYSLRTSISDGSQMQPPAANLMERRDLRPNHVHINVSHWSDFGGRNYMEDR